MSQDKKSFQNVVKGGGLISVGMLLNHVLQLVSGILVVRVLSVAEYGDFALGNATIALLNVVCLVSIPTVMVKYAVQSQSGNESVEEVSKVIASSFFIVISTSCLAVLLVISLSEFYARLVSSDNLALVLSILVFTIPIANIITLLSSYFRFRNNPAPKVIFQDILFNSLRAVLLLAAMLITLSLAGVLMLYVFSSLVTVSLFGWYFFKNKNLDLRWRPDAGTVKKLLLSGLPVLAVELIPSMESWLISSITSFYHNADVVAYFSAPNRLTAILALPITSLGYMYLPILSGLSRKSDLKQINGLYESVSKWTLLLSIPIYVYVFNQAEFVVAFLFGENYIASANVLRLITVGVCINAFFGNNYLTLVVLGGGKVLLLASIVGVLTMACVSILVVPQLGAIGSALALVAAKFTLNVVLSWYLHQRYRVYLPYSWVTIRTLVIVSLFVLAYCELVQYISSDLILLIIYTPVAFFLALSVPRFVGSVSESDAQIYLAIDNKLGPLLKKLRLR